MSPYADKQGADLFKPSPIDLRQCRLVVRWFIRKRTWFVNQELCKIWPGVQALNGELKRADLLTFGLSGIERAGGQIREGVRGLISAPAEPRFKRGPPDQTGKTIAAVLDSKSVPATLRR